MRRWSLPDRALQFGSRRQAAEGIRGTTGNELYITAHVRNGLCHCHYGERTLSLLMRGTDSVTAGFENQVLAGGLNFMSYHPLLI